MLILAVDTSTRAGSVAALQNSEVLAEISGIEDTPYSTRLFRDVELLKNRADFRLEQVDVFAVAAGPGSFTGLRVGLTAVKAWSEVHGKPVATISGLRAIAAESQTGRTPSTTNSTIETSFLASFLDARRGQIFGAVYRRSRKDGMSLALESDESILLPDEFLQMVKEKCPGSVDFVSPTPDAISAAHVREVFPDARMIAISAALAPAIGRLGWEQAMRGDLLDSIRVDANYVRRSDAEAAWRDG